MRPKLNDYAHLWTTQQSLVPEGRPLSGQYSVPRSQPMKKSNSFSRPTAPTPHAQQPRYEAAPRPGSKAWLHQALSQPQSKSSTLQSDVIHVEESDAETQQAVQPKDGATIGVPFHRVCSISAENLPKLVSDKQRRRQSWFDEERRANPNPRQASQLARQLTLPPSLQVGGAVPGMVIRAPQPSQAAPQRPWSMNANNEADRTMSDMSECHSASTNSSTCAYSTSSASSRAPLRHSAGASLTPTALRRHVYGETGYDSFAEDYYSDDQIA